MTDEAARGPSFEVEIKAWVDDWDRVERRLRDRCTFDRAFRKDDRYFVSDGEEKLFRVRTDGPHAYLTYKEKDVRDGMEVNREREFGVDEAAALVEFVEHIGCRQVFGKVKRGLRFTHDGLTAELVHVEGLGDFLEVEFVHAEDDDEVHRRAGERIRRFLTDAGVGADRIEERPYMKMLTERRGEDRP